MLDLMIIITVFFRFNTYSDGLMLAGNASGRLIGVGPNGIEGWAWDPSKPYDPVEIELISKDVVLKRVVANQFDMQLPRDYIGTGVHAFSAQLDKIPEGPFPFFITARIVGGGEIQGQLGFDSPFTLKGIVVPRGCRQRGFPFWSVCGSTLFFAEISDVRRPDRPGMGYHRQVTSCRARARLSPITRQPALSQRHALCFACGLPMA